MKTSIKLLLAALLTTGMVSAQVTLGTLKGQVFNQADDASVPSAKVWIEGAGITNRMVTDLDGKFTFDALKPGIYNLYTSAVGKDTTEINAVEIKPDGITDLGKIELIEASKGLPPIVIEYKPKLIEKDLAKIEIKTEDIAHSPLIQDPKALFASMNSDVMIQEGTNQVIVRGSRPGDVVYFIDGVKVQDLNGVPGVGIGSMTGYTGGIPAKYGDTTGGIIVLETKSYFDLYYAWKARQ